jgi:hypothetical protein
MSSSGGSVDSGPPPGKYVIQKKVKKRNYLMPICLISFCVLLLCFLILLWKGKKASPKQEEQNV